MFGTARFQSGLPYSPQPVNSAVFIAPVNSARRNSDFQVDLRATKYFTLASDVELGAIFEVFNVFNNQNFITADAIPFGEVGVTNGVYNTTGGLLTGRELFEANQLVTDPIVLADIDTSTRSGQIQREFRGFMDIDGDGVVAEEEQRIMGLLATGAEFLLPTQPKRNYRLGVELRF